MSRSSDTYRAARRNKCIRELHEVWGPEWYYHAHRNRGGVAAVYIPADRITTKASTTSSGIHAMLKRGDYAGAIRNFFGSWRKPKASGRGE